MWYQCNTVVKVALRKESVDRNGSGLPVFLLGRWSLSARRAWIEISAICCLEEVSLVALRKESVDRNSKSALKRGGYARRSPQGERG